MEVLNYNILNILKSYLPNKTFNGISTTNNNILYTPITQTEIQRRLCGGYLTKNRCFRHVKCLAYIIQKGYVVRSEYNWILQINALNGYLDMVKYIIEVIGLTIDDIRSDNNLALRWSARNGHLHVVKYLVERGLDLNDIRNMNNCALEWSVLNGHLHVVKYLINIGIQKRELKLFKYHNYELYKKIKEN